MTLTPPSFQQRQSPRSKPQPDQQDQYSDSSDSPAPIKRKRKRVIISDSSESPSPPPSQHSLSSTDSDTGSTFVPSLSEMTFGKHKATLVKPSTSVQKVVETPFLSLLESIKKPMKDPDTPPNGSINESIITSRVKDLIFGTPLHNQYLLNDMEDYTGPYLGVFLSCIETKLSKIRSPGAPVNLLAKDFDGNIRTWTFGVDGMISIHGCPQYIQFMEKNLTWALWALVHLYPKNNLYPTLMKWAANKSISSTFAVVV
ncbi:hypothetical protein BC941DRAFT_450571 [Chlamydoabsidia padenii]|nr:hypothetical protein BC941DRAFT_450571 [Chlamydoabsidia padenii]